MVDIGDLRLKHAWMLCGPIITGLVLRKAHKKYYMANTILRRYESNDVCIFYQLWVQLIATVTFTVLNIPMVENHTSCNFRKWILLWTTSLIFFSHMPNMLDFCMRTNNTPFYQMFHSRLFWPFA